MKDGGKRLKVQKNVHPWRQKLSYQLLRTCERKVNFITGVYDEKKRMPPEAKSGVRKEGRVTDLIGYPMSGVLRYKIALHASVRPEKETEFFRGRSVRRMPSKPE